MDDNEGMNGHQNKNSIYAKSDAYRKQAFNRALSPTRADAFSVNDSTIITLSRLQHYVNSCTATIFSEN